MMMVMLMQCSWLTCKLTLGVLHTMTSTITLGNHSKKMLYLRIVIKEDEEHSNHFPVIVVSCMSYTRDVDYQ